MNKIGIAIVWALLAALGVPTAEAGATEVVPGAEHMLIHATGTAGLVINLPVAAEIRSADFHVTSRGATAAFVATKPPIQPPCDDQIPSETCIYVHFLWADGRVRIRGLGSPYPAGPLEVYIVADGPLDVSFRLRGLSGSREVDALGLVTGQIVTLTGHCPHLSSCNALTYGGGVRHVRRGLVASAAYVEDPDVDTPDGWPTSVHSRGSTTTCVYPHTWFAPTTPAEGSAIRTGCDLMNTYDPTDGIARSFNLASPNSAEIMIDSAAAGDVYAGFAAYNLTGIGPDRIRAYGLWLEEGIA